MDAFTGVSLKEFRKSVGLPDDFRVTEIQGVPIRNVPRRFLIAYTEAAIFEARQWRKKVMEAYELGDKLDKYGGLLPPESVEVKEETESDEKAGR